MKTTRGYLGWQYPIGVAPGLAGATFSQPTMTSNIRLPNNPYETDPAKPIIIGGAFMRLWQATLYSLQTFGYPKNNEQAANVTNAQGVTQQRTVQCFERATLVYQPENDVPWDAACASRSDTVTLL